MFEIECTKCRVSKSWPNKDILINNWNTRTPTPHHITVTIDTRTHMVVPLIPDENMYHAAVKCKNVMFVTGAGLPTEYFPFGAAWSAMLAAAPEHKE